MDFYDARALYLADLRRLGRSENTIRSANQALALLGHSYDNTPVRLWTLADLENALERELKPASYNRYRSALISFFDYCVTHGFCRTNPAKELPTRRVVDQPKLILAPEQMLEMLDGANPVERIALALGMNTALRASDIVALKVGDVDLESLTLRTKIQKTGGYDEKPITNQLAEELRRWFSEYRRHRAWEMTGEWLLVPSYNIPPGGGLYIHVSRPITHPHRLVQRALERLGLPTEGEGFHTLRRSSARALFEKLREEGGYDHALMVVREFLNHRSVEQTQRYLGVSHERQIRDATLRGRDFLTKRCSSVCDLLHCALPEGHPLPHSTQGTDQTIAPVCWTYGTEEPRPFERCTGGCGEDRIHGWRPDVLTNPKPVTFNTPPTGTNFLCAHLLNSDGETVASQLIDINRNHNRSYANPERIY